MFCIRFKQNLHDPRLGFNGTSGIVNIKNESSFFKQKCFTQFIC